MANQEQIKAFIDLIAPSVIASCKARGWGVPSAIIAQAGLESAWGTSGLWKTCYNGWGMKWKSGCGTDYKEYTTKEQRSDGTYYTIIAKFRKYPDVASGILGYFQFIESYKRYVPVQQSKTYQDYANNLKTCGWATSIQYANNIINTVRKYSLEKYDSSETSQNAILGTEFVKGKVYTTNSDLYIRQSPAGTKLKHSSLTIDGINHSHFDDIGNAILDKGTKVTCIDVQKLETSTWVLIPSGWICAKNKTTTYLI